VIFHADRMLKIEEYACAVRNGSFEIPSKMARFLRMFAVSYSEAILYIEVCHSLFDVCPGLGLASMDIKL